MTSSNIPSTESTNAKLTAEELLTKLLTMLYVSSSYKGITWSYVEGITIASILGNELEEQYLPYLSQEDQDHYKALNS